MGRDGGSVGGRAAQPGPARAAGPARADGRAARRGGRGDRRRPGPALAGAAGGALDAGRRRRGGRCVRGAGPARARHRVLAARHDPPRLGPRAPRVRRGRRGVRGTRLAPGRHVRGAVGRTARAARGGGSPLRRAPRRGPPHAAEPRAGEDLAAVVEAWVEANPGALSEAELARQRESSWRPVRSTAAFVRAPAKGGFGPRTPAALTAAPERPGDVDLDAALDSVVRRHLRAFGPAGADDVAQWIGWKVPPVRAALERLEGGLERFEDSAGRALYDLPDAPRPDPDGAPPVRLLPWFDSVLLAYAPGRRARILPDEHRDAVYNRKNLQIRPTFLVDGLVAGTWAIEAKGKTARLTLAPLRKLPKRTTKTLVAEAERLVAFLHPDASAPSVAVSE